MHRSIPIALLAASLLTACSTELDINEPYKDITIVYGLLNQRDSIHFVKVNKAFLGEGNANDMALVRDSSEYRDEDISSAKVFRINSGGGVVESYEMHDTIITNREPGNFYSPTQKLYYFRTPFAQNLNAGGGTVPMYLWQDNTYRIELDVKGKTIVAQTNVVNDFTISQFNVNTPTANLPVNFMNTAGTQYGTYTFKVVSKPNGKRYEVKYRFRFDEITGTDTVPRAITRRLGSKVATADNQDLEFLIAGESFYSHLESSIKSEPGWQGVSKRIFRGIDFLTSVANDDFHIYLTLTEPVTGIVNDRPAFSNIDGGIGIWGSRFTKDVLDKRLNINSLNELVNGPYTINLRFCSPLDAFPCP